LSKFKLKGTQKTDKQVYAHTMFGAGESQLILYCAKDLKGISNSLAAR